MIRLFSSTAALFICSALLLLAVDAKIYNASGWTRDHKFATVLGWTYGAVALLIFIGLLIFI